MRLSLDIPRPTVADFVAGASVALVLIPQSLGYADLAGLPTFIGLFASALPLLVFSLFASSPFLQTGPTAIISLLTFAALPTLTANPSADELDSRVAMAALLALMVGAIRFVFGSLRFGTIVRAISLPVITGFTSAAGILIIASQLPRILGIEGLTGGVLPNAFEALSQAGDWNVAGIVLAVITVALFHGSRAIHPLVPGVLFAVVLGVVWSMATSFDGPTIGDVPEGLPPVSFDLPFDQIGPLVPAALVIALIGFAEPVSIARTFANETGQRWNPNREFVASGIANTVAAFSGAYPVGGSFSRSSVNRLAGAQTRWAGGVTGVVVLIFLLFASVLEPLPTAVLGAIVLAAVLSLIKPRLLWSIWKRSPAQALLTYATFAVTLLSAPRVERGVLFGVGLSIVVHFIRRFRVEQASEGAVTILTPKGMLWMGTESAFASELAEAAEGNAQIVRVDFSATPFIDDAAVQAMKATAARLQESNRSLEWVNPPPRTEMMFANIAAAAAASSAQR